MYLALFVIFDMLEVIYLVNTVLHPRPHNIVICVVNAVFCICTFLWTHRDRYQYADDYKKEVRDWKKRRAKAKKSREPFEEEKPVRPKHLVPEPLSIFFIYLFSLYVAFAVSVVPDLALANHMPYEYKRDIAKCKQSTYYNYSIFPDEIPKEAKNVKWIMQPSFLQGAGYEVLMFEASQEYIEGVIRDYGMGVTPCEVEDDMIFRSRLDKDRLSHIRFYKIYDNEDWNHVHMYGFFVDEERHQIGFFCV